MAKIVTWFKKIVEVPSKLSPLDVLATKAS